MDYISQKIIEYIDNNRGLYALEGYIDALQIRDEFYSIVSYLNQRKNNNSDFVIGIYLDKDYRYLLMLLACMYVGITYIPMSKKLPIERVNQIIEIAEIQLIISDISIMVNSETLIIQEIVTGGNKNCYARIFDYTRDSVLYIIFTSGSTGIPKGVMIPRRGYEAYLQWMNRYYSVTEEDKLLFVTEFTFDISLVDVGFLLEKNVAFYFSKFDGSIITVMQELEKYQISIISTVPSNFNMLLSSRLIDRFQIRAFNVLILSGSKITKKLYEKIKKRYPDSKFYNGYGPTEATIFITSKLFESGFDFDENNASVGSELTDMDIILLDKDGNKIEDESIGTVFVSGPQVMLGYKNNSIKTREVLVEIDNRTYYNVGDLGYRKNNNLYIVGRVDDTIKTRGYRINLSDIESYVDQVEYINENVLIALPDENIENKLYLFVTTNKSITKEKIYNDLKMLLPSYQMPADIILKNKMPLNNSGKISKNLLQEDIKLS